MTSTVPTSNSASQPSDLPVFDAYSANLMKRFNLTEPAAIAHQLVTLASALGPSVRIRDPFGHALPLTFSFGLSAPAPSYEAGLAMALAQDMLVLRSANLAKLREMVDTKQFRACYGELVGELKLLEAELAKPEQPSPPPFYSFSIPNPDKVKAERELARQEIIKTISEKRQAAACFRLHLHPTFTTENPTWTEILGAAKLSFDSGFTATSCDGYAIETLIAMPGKRLEEISGFLEASRIGRAVPNATGEIVTNAINCAFNIGHPLLSRALTQRRIVQSGVLDGFLLLDSIVKPGANILDALMANEPQAQWNALIEKLFTQRVRTTLRVFKLDAGAYPLFEQFRTRCVQPRFAGADLQRFARTWPDTLLKVALLFQILSGTADDTVGAPAMERALGVLTLMCEEHVRLVEKYGSNALRRDGIEGMVARVASVGRLTRRDLFRRYNRKTYAMLQDVLDDAVAQGRLFFDGKFVNMVTAPSEVGATNDENVGVSASVDSPAEILEQVA